MATLASFVPRGRCFCPACGSAIAVRPADELCLQINPRARFVVHETFADQVGPTGQRLLFACLGCGAGVAADGSARTVVCGSCQQSSYVPDGLWRQLRPIPAGVAFFLVCEYDASARAEARWSDGDAKQTDAASATLTYEQFATLARDDDSDVRRAVAANPVAPPDILFGMTADDDSDVREGLAANPAATFQLLDKLAGDADYGVRQKVAASLRTHPATLYRLVDDTDSDVSEALLANPNLPAEAIEALSRSADYEKRVAAAKHPLITMETLKRLSKDDDSDVQEAAQARLRGR
jgi:hypothetical protein